MNKEDYKKLRLQNNVTFYEISRVTGIPIILLKKIEDEDNILFPGDQEIMIEYYYKWLPKHKNKKN